MWAPPKWLSHNHNTSSQRTLIKILAVNFQWAGNIRSNMMTWVAISCVLWNSIYGKWSTLRTLNCSIDFDWLVNRMGRPKIKQRIGIHLETKFYTIDTFCSVSTKFIFVDILNKSLWRYSGRSGFVLISPRWKPKMGKKNYIKEFMTLSLFSYATKWSKFGVGFRVCESTHINGWKGGEKTKSPNSEWLLTAMQKQSGI